MYGKYGQKCKDCGTTFITPDNFTNKNQQFYFIYWPKPWTWGNINIDYQTNYYLNPRGCVIINDESEISDVNKINQSNKPWDGYIDIGQSR